MPVADPDPVSLRDLEVADRIARAVRRGRAGDRQATIEQIVAAFGESSPTPEARRRAARALALAGVATVPDLAEAARGERVVLEVRRPRRRRALLFGVLALAALIGAAAAVASTVDFGNDTTGELPADAPSASTAAPATAAGTSTAASTPPAATSTTTTSAAKPQPTAAERRRARRARARRARAQRARRRRARARSAARRRVTVRLTASQPTFLCVDGDGRRLFDGTLSGSQTFRARVVRLNVGLGPSTRVTANGKAVPLTASPTGVQITPRGQVFLPLGARPCA